MLNYFVPLERNDQYKHFTHTSNSVSEFSYYLIKINCLLLKHNKHVFIVKITEKNKK